MGHGNDVGRKATLRLLNSVWGQAYLDHPRAAKLVASLEVSKWMRPPFRTVCLGRTRGEGEEQSSDRSASVSADLDCRFSNLFHLPQAGVHLVATRISPKNLARLSEKLSVARGDIGVLLLANAVVADARMALDLFRLQGQRMALMKAAAAGKSSRDSGSCLRLPPPLGLRVDGRTRNAHAVGSWVQPHLHNRRLWGPREGRCGLGGRHSRRKGAGGGRGGRPNVLGAKLP